MAMALMVCDSSLHLTPIPSLPWVGKVWRSGLGPELANPVQPVCLSHLKLNYGPPNKKKKKNLLGLLSSGLTQEENL